MAEANRQAVTPRQARIAIAVFFFVSGFTYSTWASRIPTIQRQLHLNEAQLGAVLFALPIGLLLTLPVTSRLLQRYSNRSIMLIGGVLFNIMLALLGFMNHTWQLVIVLFCFGSSRNLFNISMNAQSINVQALYSRSIIATFHGLWSIAGFGGAALGSLMIMLNITPMYHFLFVGIVLSILACWFYPHSIHQQPAPMPKKPLFSLPDKHLLQYGMICFASMACEGTMYDWSAIYLQKAVHATDKMASAGFALYMVAMTAGRFTGDRLSGKLGVKSMLKYSGVLIFTGLLIAVLFPFLFSTAIGFMLTGFGVSCVVPMVFSITGKSKTMSSGSAIASVSTVGYLGFLIVPPVVGFVAQAANLRWSFALMALLGSTITWLVSGLKD